MTIADVLICAALAVFVLAWWLRRLPRRPVVLLAAALVALAAGAWGLVDDRWQDGFGGGVALLLLAGLGIGRWRRSPPRSGPPYLSGGLVALLALGAAAAIVIFPVFPLPKPSGPSPVGVRTVELDDAARLGVFAAAPDAPRRLLVRVWYPAGDVHGRKPAPYVSQAEARHTVRELGLGFLKHIRTNSYPDAPLAAAAHDLPVVFYSHGLDSFLGQHTVLMEHLASHGYIVVSIQHTYDSLPTVFPNGDVAGKDPAISAGDNSAEGEAAYQAQRQGMAGATVAARMEGFLRSREHALAARGRSLQSAPVWLADRLFVHDALQAGRVPPSLRDVAAAGRFDHVGEMGMSFGGATAGSVCVVDRRCAAGINLDGGDRPFQAFGATVPVPFLMFHEDLRYIAEQVGAKPPRQPHSFNEFSYDGLGAAGARPDILRVQVRGARHPAISDSTLFVRRPFRDPVLGSTPTPVMIGVQNDMVLGFFDHYLRGRANGYPQAQLRAYADWVSVVPNTAVGAWWNSLSPAERVAITARIERLRATPAP